MGRFSKDKRDIYYRKAKEVGFRARSAVADATKRRVQLVQCNWSLDYLPLAVESSVES